MRAAAYARYSSDRQNEASLEDQLRNVRTFCERQGWPEPAIYTDAAMSGSRDDRPAYCALLRAAEAGEFDVIVVDDSYRFARDMVEFPRVVRRLKFLGVRVVGVSDGFDSDRDSYKLEASMRGIMGESYLDTLAKNVHRGQTGRAIAGASAGGLPYGYRVAGVGHRAIDEAQAAVVRRIYAEYLEGRSPRSIADGLNRDRVPSSRGSTWSLSAIHGDIRRGIGILANPIYAGRQIWNRSRWLKDPDRAKRRVRRDRPESEWIITEHPELAIVDVDTWNAAQARIRHAGGRRGRKVSYLLSGILRCPSCHGPMVVINGYSYGCATSRARGTAVCAYRGVISRRRVEPAILAGIKHELLGDAAWERAERALAAAIGRAVPAVDEARARLAAARRVHGHIVTALRAGIITATTRAELLSAEAELAAAQAAVDAAARQQPARMLPRARDHWRALVETLEDENDLQKRRSAIEALVGKSIVLKEEAGEIYAEIGGDGRYMELVAGARFGLYLPEAVRIRIPPQPKRNCKAGSR